MKKSIQIINKIKNNPIFYILSIILIIILYFYINWKPWRYCEEAQRVLSDEEICEKVFQSLHNKNIKLNKSCYVSKVPEAIRILNGYVSIINTQHLSFFDFYTDISYRDKELGEQGSFLLISSCGNISN